VQALWNDPDLLEIPVRRARKEEAALYMKAEEFDLSKARRPAYEQRRVNVDFPVWMIRLLDREAGRIGIPRQSLIKMIVSNHLEARAAT
jgi:hypothetical protein